MAQESKKLPDLESDDSMTESENFVLPKAPPVPLPNKDRRSRFDEEEQTQATPASELAGPTAPSNEDSSNTCPQLKETELDHENDSTHQVVWSPDSPIVQELENQNSGASVVSPYDQQQGSNLLIGVILILLATIAGLLIFWPSGSSLEQAESTSPPIPPSDSNSEIIAVQNENRGLREQVAELTTEANHLKEEVRSLQTARDSAVADLARVKDAYDKNLAVMRVEVTRLEAIERKAASAGEKPIAPQSPVQIPVPRTDGTVYRVTGVRPGDTLNVRSGPGSGFSVVTQLDLGVRVTVIGSAVSNGPDWWFPCQIGGNVVEPSTGSSKPWTAKGWINSAFLEENN